MWAPQAVPCRGIERHRCVSRNHRDHRDAFAGEWMHLLANVMRLSTGSVALCVKALAHLGNEAHMGLFTTRVHMQLTSVALLCRTPVQGKASAAEERS